MNNTFAFLKKLDKNNNRPWFQANKAAYEQSYNEMIAFTENVLNEMSLHDHIEAVSPKKSLFRIYRDVRFGKDKTPYKTHWGGFLRRAGVENRGGYYFHIAPKDSYVMGGFFNPNKDDLLHIRKHLSQDADELRAVIQSRKFKKAFDELRGSQLKSAPRGFEKDDPNIDLLRYKQFLVRHDFTEDQVSGKNFHQIVSRAFQEMRPFFDGMSDMLNTDLNGRPLL